MDIRACSKSMIRMLRCYKLANPSPKWIHKRWEAPESILRDAGIMLGKDYPYPIVDHKVSRQNALEAFSRFRKD